MAIQKHPKPKLLYVIIDADQAGAPFEVLHLINALHTKYTISCACPGGWLSQQLQKIHGVTVYILQPHNRRLGSLRELAAIYEKAKPDIIHYHGVRAGFNIFPRLVADESRVKIVYTEHLWTRDFHLPSRFREAIQINMLKLLGAKTNHTIAVSKAVKDFIVSKGMARASATTVIYPGITLIGTKKPVDDPVIGTLGRLSWVKGTDILLHAITLLMKPFPTIRCRIAGDGPEKQSLMRLAKKLQIEQHVEWLGHVSDPTDFYRSLQVYVQPSISESFGIAPLEAMSAGVPVVASSGGALPEVVNNAGMIFQSKNVNDLAHAISILLKNPGERRRYRAKGLKRAAHFTIARMAAAHDSLYNRLIS